MFGALLPSRQIQTLTPLTPTTYTLLIPPLPTFTHLVVFLLPDALLPPDTAAAVYIRFPGSANSEFRFLGAIGNEKPSAIFRVRDGRGEGGGEGGGFEGGGMGNGGGGGEDEMVDEEEGSGLGGANGAGAGAGKGGIGGGEEDIALGIAIEPLSQVLASLASLQTSSSSSVLPAPPTATPSSSTALTKLPPQQPSPPASAAVTTKVLARRIIRNAFNFLASFAGTMTVVEGREVEVVPLRAFRDWWAKFERGVEADPGFLERDDGEGDG